VTSSRTVDRLKRILALIPYVLERDAVDVGEVIDRFGYTLGQLSRDLDTVFVCGLPGYGPGDLMEAYIVDDEVIIDAADYFTRAPRLTPMEALGLLAAGMTVMGMGEGTPALQSAVAKLAKVAVPDSEPALSVDVLDETAHVRALRQAAAEGRLVRMTYRSVGKEQTTERDIEPWTIFHTMGRWYVSGHCRLVDGERTFRVDRIRKLDILDETFPRPDVAPMPGVGYSPSEGDVSALIDLAASARWVLEYYPVEVVSQTGESTRIRFWAPDPEVTARLLIRLGDSARLVEGREVGERLASLGASLLSKYS
jgi:proteasome accessory factor C